MPIELIVHRVSEKKQNYFCYNYVKLKYYLFIYLFIYLLEIAGNRRTCMTLQTVNK